MRKKSFTKDVWKYILGTLIIILYGIPLYVLIAMSFKPITEITSALTLPSGFYLGNFKKLFEEGTVFRSLMNTSIVSVSTIILQVLFSCMAAYPLARNRTKYNNIIRGIMLGVMMIPPLSILVGVYSVLVSMGAISTYWGIVLVSVAMGLPTPIFLYYNFILSIPKALDEASIIDGCNPFQTFFYIILPQLKPVTVTIIILNGIGMWNEYGYSLYVLQKPKMYTMPLLISQYFSSGSANDLNGAAAGACIAITPVIIAYLFLQKYFVRGIVDSAVKG